MLYNTKTVLYYDNSIKEPFYKGEIKKYNAGVYCLIAFHRHINNAMPAAATDVPPNIHAHIKFCPVCGNSDACIITVMLLETPPAV